MKSLLLISFLRVLSWLPLGAARRVGRVLGWFARLVPSRMADTTKINIALCYPEMSAKERNVLAKSSISQTFQAMAEAGPAWLWPTQKVMDHILEVEGLALLQEEVATGRGVVILTPHLGNWEVFGLYVSQCGCGPSSQLYQAPQEPKLDRLLYRARSRGGARMVATDSKGVGLLLKSLKSGEIAGILPDQVPPRSGGEFAPFFHRDALTMTLVPRLLQKTGARIVLGYAARVCRDGKHGWKIVFRTLDQDVYASDMLTALKAMNRSVASLINENPAQYQWEYKRFKRVPEGQQRPY